MIKCLMRELPTQLKQTLAIGSLMSILNSLSNKHKREKERLSIALRIQLPSRTLSVGRSLRILR